MMTVCLSIIVQKRERDIAVIDTIYLPDYKKYTFRHDRVFSFYYCRRLIS